MYFEDFITLAREIHGNKYDYEPWEGNRRDVEKVTITCHEIDPETGREHGVFTQTQSNHVMRKAGCPKCAKRYNLSNEEFKEKVRRVHGNKYNLDKCEYKNTQTKVTCTCKEHGDFTIYPNALLSGLGCQVCDFLDTNKTYSHGFWNLTDKKKKAKYVIEKARMIYGDKYDYSLIKEVETSRSVLKIICPEHGVFERNVHAFFNGNACPKCGKVIRFTQNDFEDKIKEIYGDKLDLSKSVFKSKTKKLIVTCPKHGDLYMTPNSLFKASDCPICSFIDNDGKDHTAFWSLIDPERKAKAVIERFKQVHGDKYDYSLIKTVNKSTDKVDIICSEHGVFSQGIEEHLYGQGCPICNARKIPEEKIIAEIKNVHGDKYGFENFVYRGKNKKVTLTCPEHGDFDIDVRSITESGLGCPICDYLDGKTKSQSFWKFVKPEVKAKYVIEKCKQVHGDKYDYSMLKEICHATDDIDIICPKHGHFKQSLSNHLCGTGCPDCAGKHEMTQEEFMKRVKELYGEKYGTNIKYTRLRDMLHIECPEHGPFDVGTKDFLRGKSCHMCDFIEGNRGKNHKYWKAYTPEQKAYGVIERAKRVHGGKYTYEHTKTLNCSTDIMLITCPEHGVFSQAVWSHLLGSGCQDCLESKLEKETATLLSKNNIKYEEKFTSDWLGRQHLDFYLPEQNIAIECQGRQHFEHDDFFKHDNFLKRRENDIKKFNLVAEHGMKMLYVMPKDKVDVGNVNCIQEIYTKENVCYNQKVLLQKIREAT